MTAFFNEARLKLWLRERLTVTYRKLASVGLIVGARTRARSGRRRFALATSIVGDRLVTRAGRAPRNTFGAFDGLASSLLLGSSCAVSAATWAMISKFRPSDTAPRPTCNSSVR